MRYSLASVESELCVHQLGKRMARNIDASDGSGSLKPMVTTPHLGYSVGGVAKMEIKYGRKC